MASTDKMMWFGNRERMGWIPAPDANYDGSVIGWNGAGAIQLLNGGAITRRSVTGHRTYNYSWSVLSRDEIRNIADYAEGVYGNSTIYFLDRFAMDKNLLPQHWATPRLMLSDGPKLAGDGSFVIEYPISVTSSAGYPTRAVILQPDSSWPAAATRPKLYIPIPPGHVLWFGMHGLATAGTPTPLIINPTVGNPTQIVNVLSNNDFTRFNYSWDGDVTSGVELSFTGTGYAAITGMMAQVLPKGRTPAQGNFISGQGHSGTHFTTLPSTTHYNAALDKMSLTAQLIEDEAWR